MDLTDVVLPPYHQAGASRGRGFGNGSARGQGRGRGGAAETEMLGIVTDRSTRVFIRNIPLSLIERFDKDALRAELEAAGPIVRYTMFVDKARRFTGQAMCTFETPAAAAAAVEALNGRVLEGEVEPIEVEMAASHGVVLAETLKEERHLERLHTEQWKHDRYGKEFFSRGASRGRGAGRGRAGGFGQSNPGADLTGII